jgi:hypothetical protein
MTPMTRVAGEQLETGARGQPTLAGTTTRRGGEADVFRGFRERESTRWWIPALRGQHALRETRL